jgi:hypothetical protein
MGAVLDRIGEHRFRNRAGGMQTEIAREGEAQCLYRSLMTALGYSQNKAPFAELARRVPLAKLEAPAAPRNGENSLFYSLALLLGTAGLLPSQRGYHLEDSELARIDGLSVAIRPASVMSHRDWCLFRVRPHNQPVRRLVAMGYLLNRFRGDGLLHGMLKRVKEALLSKDISGLEKAVTVTGNVYWASHRDFGVPLGRECPALLGGERAAEIAVNVLLPFILAHAGNALETSLEEAVMKVYRTYRPLPGNSVIRHMVRHLGLDGKVVNSACRQQGLIHIYKNYCVTGKCRECRMQNSK